MFWVLHSKNKTRNIYEIILHNYIHLVVIGNSSKHTDSQIAIIHCTSYAERVWHPYAAAPCGLVKVKFGLLCFCFVIKQQLSRWQTHTLWFTVNVVLLSYNTDLLLDCFDRRWVICLDTWRTFKECCILYRKYLIISVS